eukprot:m.675037 g.675037  ORF g.675037 m.675037 type:complete len:655 (-) comp22785_c0_seq1:427-2391(-)
MARGLLGMFRSSPKSNRDSVASSTSTDQNETVAEPSGGSGDLPPGWEQRTAQNGRPYYVNHTTQTTQWSHPSAQSPATPRPQSNAHVGFGGFGGQHREQTSMPAQQPAQNNLPAGWEERTDSRGRKYYVDHNTRTTTWQRPTPETQAQQNLYEASRTSWQAVSESYGRRGYGDDDSSASQPTVASDSTDLPRGWEHRRLPDGRSYFVDHNTRTTHWEHPHQHGRSAAVSRPLPSGWEVRSTADGRQYFVDHNTKTTTFTDPRLELEKDEAEGVPQYKRDFRYKQRYLQEQHCKQKSGQCKLPVQRENLFHSSMTAVMSYSPEELKRQLYVIFDNEAGLDYGGLSREWFFRLSQEILNPSYCLFEYATEGNYTLAINPNSGINPEHLSLFRFIGRIIALAIFHERFIDHGFTMPFYKQVLGRTLELRDLESVDREYYKSLKYFLDNDIDELYLCQTFTANKDEFGIVSEVDLIENGSEIDVTDENKGKFVSLATEHRLTRGTSEQMEAFKRGFSEIIPLQAMNCFDEREFDMLLIGVAEFDVDEWAANTQYRNYTRSDEQIVWFWEFVRKLTNEKRARLLQFVTGSCRLPIGGFKDLMGSNGPMPFCIERIKDSTQLPQTHTCFNRIDLPAYKNKADLEQKLTFAIEETAGFGLE